MSRRTERSEKWTDLTCSLLLHFFCCSSGFLWVSQPWFFELWKKKGRGGGKPSNYIFTWIELMRKSQVALWENKTLRQPKKTQNVSFFLIPDLNLCQLSVSDHVCAQKIFTILTIWPLFKKQENEKEQSDRASFFILRFKLFTLLNV